VDVLDPPEEDQDARFLLANVGAILILVGIFGFGFTLLGGVVEEKQSRVVEVVLSTVRPRDLLMGKVLGIGALGLFQLAVFVVASLAAALATQAIDLPATTPGAIAILALWFILGYLLYATVLGAVGALASRMEEASNASTPVTLVAMLSYFVAVFGVAQDPTGPVAIITTYLPITAPFVVPLRAAFDAIALWELALAAAITLVTVWILFEVGARIYTGAVLQTAGRTRLRDAWRAGR
jgi:ABC-2 type transport system permease protein